jgi:hypothetical protein
MTNMAFATLTRFGNLTLVATHGNTWILVCDCGEVCEKHASNVRAGRTTSCGQHGHGFRRRIGAPRTYIGWHTTLRTRRGPAKEYLCACGAQAHEWSYNGGCPDEYEGTDNRGGKPMPYCEHEQHYTAKCRSCHQRYDRAMAKAKEMVAA